jgi:hypothetical protein
MLCDFARHFPKFVGELLDREAGLQRRFREESLTDMWVASLVPLRPYGVKPDLAIEAETGADLEIWFLSRKLDRGLGFVVQAKRAKCKREHQTPFNCSLRKWGKHRFPELDHRGGAGRIRGSQARDLVRAAQRTGRSVYPLYAFYTPGHVHYASGNLIESVMLADGHEVRERIVKGLWVTRRHGGAKRRSRAKFKELGNLYKLLIPLSRMFCVSPWRPAGSGVERQVADRIIYLRLVAERVEIMNIPDPEEVLKAMVDEIKRRRRDGSELPLPSITKDIPADILLLAQGEMRGLPASDRDGGVVARTRIAFVASFDDEHEW